jgi:hypothetical protein
MESKHVMKNTGEYYWDLRIYRTARFTKLAAILLLAYFFWAFSALADVSLSDQVNHSTDSASKEIKKAEVALYVYNDDDDSLDVSLYIDSVPKGKTDVSKGKEETFGNFTVNQGIHRFKIIWKDEDTNEVYESEIKKGDCQRRCHQSLYHGTQRAGRIRPHREREKRE